MRDWPPGCALLSPGQATLDEGRAAHTGSGAAFGGSTSSKYERVLRERLQADGFPFAVGDGRGKVWQDLRLALACGGEALHDDGRRGALARLALGALLHRQAAVRESAAGGSSSSAAGGGGGGGGGGARVFDTIFGAPSFAEARRGVLELELTLCLSHPEAKAALAQGGGAEAAGTGRGGAGRGGSGGGAGRGAGRKRKAS